MTVAWTRVDSLGTLEAWASLLVPGTGEHKAGAGACVPVARKPAPVVNLRAFEARTAEL